MKKTIITLTILICSSIAIAQQPSTIDKLIGKWKMVGVQRMTYEKVYTKTEIKCYLNGKFYADYMYYLSDTPNETFASSKVGVLKNGKYIYIFNKERNDFVWFEIKNLTNSLLVTKNMKHSFIDTYVKIE